MNGIDDDLKGPSVMPSPVRQIRLRPALHVVHLENSSEDELAQALKKLGDDILDEPLPARLIEALKKRRG